MSEILLRAEDARDAATDVKKAATEANDQFEALKSRLASLADSFRGRTAEAWDARFEEWRTSAIQLTESLDSLGQFLTNAADQIESVDESIAGQLG